MTNLDITPDTTKRLAIYAYNLSHEYGFKFNGDMTINILMDDYDIIHNINTREQIEKIRHET